MDQQLVDTSSMSLMDAPQQPMQPPQQQDLRSSDDHMNAAAAAAALNAGSAPSSQDDGCKSLYVGNLDPRVTDLMLSDIFKTVGDVTHAKIIPDRNYSHGGLNYGFVDMVDHKTADTALQTLNGRKIFGHEIKVNWAFQGSSTQKEDTTNHFHIFVGDLSPEVNDQVLSKAFSAFGTMSDARVMWDMNTGKSRGYGFVAFREKADAEQAINSMNGEWLGSRSIRVNWANQKNPQAQPQGPQPTNNPSGQPLSYEIITAQTSYSNTTVYVGNLSPTTQQTDLFPLFQPYGYIVEVRLQPDRGFAFIKYVQLRKIVGS